MDIQEEANNKCQVGWNLCAMTEKDGEVAEKLWILLVNRRTFRDAEYTEDKVEQESAWCLEAMSSIFEATVKRLCGEKARVDIIKGSAGRTGQNGE